MSEVFRKHYSYGETIPTLDTHVGMTFDIYEVAAKPAPVGPYFKGVFVATAGPMKSSPMIVEPLQENDSKIVNLSNIPVAIPSVRAVDISLIFDLVNYRWTPSPDFPRDNGIVTFELRLRAACTLLGKSYTFPIDQRPCSITLTKQLPQLQQMSFSAPVGWEGSQQAAQPFLGQSEMGTVRYPRNEERMQGQVSNGGGSDPRTQVTDQLDIEERLRQLSTKLLTHS